jgi:hypothetical protein
VFTCTFSGWVEAFPIRTEKAQEVTGCLLKEIIPWFGIPVSIGLDNGPAFVAEVVQLMAKGLGITWKLQTAYHSQALNVASCYVCGGTNMGDHWPRKAREKQWEAWVPFDETTFHNHRKSVWLLKTSIIGNYCIFYPKGQFSALVGDLTCLGQKFYNNTAEETQWREAPNHTEPQPHPLANFSNLQKA